MIDPQFPIKENISICILEKNLNPTEIPKD